MLKTKINNGWVCRPWGYGTESFNVDLPHDYSIHQTPFKECKSLASGAYYPGGSLIYEKQLTVTEQMCRGRAILRFEGIYMNAQVFFDDKPVARQPYGYMTFHADITQYLTVGEHTVKAIACADALPNSRWYAGSGIFRSVYLLTSGCGGFAPDGVFVSPKVNENGGAEISVTAELQGSLSGAYLKCGLFDSDGLEIARACANAEETTALTLFITEPKLWSPESPYLYTVRLTLENGEVLDTEELRTGIRTLELSKAQGLLLNGKPIKLYGGCVHHDCGLLGSASFPDAERRKIRLMLENGFNAVRCAHNPPSPDMLDACDELGMLVLDEFTDMWNIGKNPYDYHLYFDEWHDRDLRAWLKRDRNHPSIIIWSTGNEIPERDGSANGYALQRELVATVKELGGDRLVTNALNNINRKKADMLEANLQKTEDDYFAEKSRDFLAPLDVAGYNYLGRRYLRDLELFPDRFILGTESVAGECAEYIALMRENPRVIGDFLWTSLDYLGEAGIGNVRKPGDGEKGFCQSFPWRYGNCGDIDMLGDKRPQSYFRDAVLGRLDAPYIAVQQPAQFDDDGIVSYWGWPERVGAWEFPGYEGRDIRVDVYSRAASVTLSLNGKELATESVSNYMASFRIKYEPGILEARDDIGVRTLKTPGRPARIELTADRSEFDKPDSLIYAVARVTDIDGNIVYGFTDEIFFACEGGKILACGSANPVSSEMLDGTSAKAWHGSVMCIVKTGTEPVTIKAAATWLSGAQLNIEKIG